MHDGISHYLSMCRGIASLQFSHSFGMLRTPACGNYTTHYRASCVAVAQPANPLFIGSSYVVLSMCARIACLFRFACCPGCRVTLTEHATAVTLSKSSAKEQGGLFGTRMDP